MCRAAPRLSAATSAQKPCGSFSPPLSGSHAGNPAARTFITTAAATPAATELASKKRFMSPPKPKTKDLPRVLWKRVGDVLAGIVAAADTDNDELTVVSQVGHRRTALCGGHPHRANFLSGHFVVRT